MLLCIRGVTIEYRRVGVADRVVRNASIDVPAGTVVGLVGESGCGKSTLALGVLGLTRSHGRIVSGSVRFEGRELLGLSDDEWRAYRGKQIALVTQHPRGSLNPVKPVGEQIAAYYRAHSNATADEARRRTLDLLEHVGINDPKRRVHAFPHELSGGMAQRVLIAMALSCSPKLLIADEPTTALDVTIQAQILDLLDQLRREHGLAMLLITHDMGVVANYCDRVYLMNGGEIVEEATVERFFEEAAHPATIALLAAEGTGYDHRAVRLRGLPVDTRRVPPGCHLHRRCPFATEGAGCYSVHPELSEVGDGHRVRCHRASDVSAFARQARLAKHRRAGSAHV